MADETKEALPPLDVDKKPEVPAQDAEVKDVKDDEPPVRQPKPKVEEKENNRIGYELRQRDKQIKELNDKISNLESLVQEQTTDTDSIPDKGVLDKIEKFEEKLTRLESEKTTEAEIQSVLAKNPDYKRFEPTLRKYATNEAYRNVPVDFIADGLDRRFKGVEDESSKNQTGGHTRRKEPGAKTDWLTASKDDYERKLQDVLHKR